MGGGCVPRTALRRSEGGRTAVRSCATKRSRASVPRIVTTAGGGGGAAAEAAAVAEDVKMLFRSKPPALSRCCGARIGAGASAGGKAPLIVRRCVSTINCSIKKWKGGDTAGRLSDEFKRKKRQHAG